MGKEPHGHLAAGAMSAALDRLAALEQRQREDREALQRSIELTHDGLAGIFERLHALERDVLRREEDDLVILGYKGSDITNRTIDRLRALHESPAATSPHNERNTPCSEP